MKTLGNEFINLSDTSCFRTKKCPLDTLSFISYRINDCYWKIRYTLVGGQNLVI